MVRTAPFLALSSLAFVSQVMSVSAQEIKEPLPKRVRAPALEAGDPAPALKVSKWLQGDAVSNFEPGKIYVVEFWAAWCGSRIRHLPRFADLQSRFGDQGVTVIAFTSRNIRGVAGNTEDEVAALVEKRGPTLDIRFAYADDETSAGAWRPSGGHFGTFIVDRTGRIAYAGGPLLVELALSKVLAGGASAKQIGDEMHRIEAEYRAVGAALERGDPDVGLRKLKEFEAKYPLLADALPVAGLKLADLLKRRQGREYADTLVTKAIKKKNVFLLEMACFLLCEQEADEQLTALGVRAAEAIVRIDGGTDAQSLLRLAGAHHVNGDTTKAKEFAVKAIHAAREERPELRLHIEEEAQRWGARK